MKLEDRLLFACARQNFDKVHQQIVAELARRPGLDWETVFKTADLHGLAPLLYVNLQRCSAQGPNIPANIIDRLRQHYMKNIAAKEQLAANLTRAISVIVSKLSTMTRMRWRRNNLSTALTFSSDWSWVR